MLWKKLLRHFLGGLLFLLECITNLTQRTTGHSGQAACGTAAAACGTAAAAWARCIGRAFINLPGDVLKPKPESAGRYYLLMLSYSMPFYSVIAFTFVSKIQQTRYGTAAAQGKAGSWASARQVCWQGLQEPSNRDYMPCSQCSRSPADALPQSLQRPDLDPGHKPGRRASRLTLSPLPESQWG